MTSSVIIPCLWLNDELFNMTVDCVRGLYEQVDEVIIINKDRSYAKNVNVGLKIATGDYIIICNNDISFIQHDWLEHLLNPLKDYDISSIRTTDVDGYETEDRLEEDAKFGSIWAMKREVYEKLGPLDESFGRGYFEDLDYHHRAKLKKFKIVKNHAGLVEHRGKATFSEIDTKDETFSKAHHKFEKKWGKTW